MHALLLTAESRWKGKKRHTNSTRWSLTRVLATVCAARMPSQYAPAEFGLYFLHHTISEKHETHVWIRAWVRMVSVGRVALTDNTWHM